MILAASAAIVPLNLTLQARTPSSPSGQDRPLILPRAAVLRPLLLGFHPLAADLYWLRTVQYFGDRVQTGQQPVNLYALVDLVTSLDSHFVEAYQLGGLFLDIAKRYPEAIAIYEKGIAANPQRWELPYDLGRLYYLDLKDDAAALRWWEIAERQPGRPPYLARFIARLYARTGQLETALELWQDMYERSSNDWVRETAKREMDKILGQMHMRSAPGAGR